MRKPMLGGFPLNSLSKSGREGRALQSLYKRCYSDHGTNHPLRTFLRHTLPRTDSTANNWPFWPPFLHNDFYTTTSSFFSFVPVSKSPFWAPLLSLALTITYCHILKYAKTKWRGVPLGLHPPFDLYRTLYAFSYIFCPNLYGSSSNSTICHILINRFLGMGPIGPHYPNTIHIPWYTLHIALFCTFFHSFTHVSKWINCSYFAFTLFPAQTWRPIDLSNIWPSTSKCIE